MLDTTLDLLSWIVERKVCWEFMPYYVMSDNKKLQVGWELTLYARHGTFVKDDPGCDECEHLYLKLEDLAHRVLPPELESITYQFVPFEPCFYLRPESKFASEVGLVVRILHRSGFFDPADEKEASITKEVEKNLKSQGVHRRTWG